MSAKQMHVAANFPQDFTEEEKQQLEPYMEQLTGSKLGKKYDKAVYCHSAHLTYMQSTSQKCWAGCTAGIKIARRNINNLRYADDTTLITESKEELKSLLMRVKEERERAGLRLNIKKLRSWHLAPLLHGKQKGEKVEVVTDFLFLGSKITADVDCIHEI